MSELYHVIESQQFTLELLDELYEMADELDPERSYKFLNDKTFFLLFYEPSTRTRVSFQMAMHKLGGSSFMTENAFKFSSVAKGESLEDTIRYYCGMFDLIVLRHPDNNSSQDAVSVATKPIINGGSGSHQHPTQALLDLYTIRCEIGRQDNLDVVMIGDPKYSRTIRSLCYLLSKYPGNHITFLSPDSLKMGQDIKEHLTKHQISFDEFSFLNHEVLSKADVIYVTRIQTDRVPEDADRQHTIDNLLADAEPFILKPEHLDWFKKDSIIMHPMPIQKGQNRELQIDPETDERCVWIEQANDYGLRARMALLLKILNG